MNPNDLDHLFEKTFEDRRLSRSERKALKEVVEELDPNPEQRLALLGLAFDKARRAFVSARDRQVLGWLEGLTRTLFPRDVPDRGEACFAPHQDCADRLRDLFEEAERSAEICVFTITDDTLTRAILRAHERGIAVRVITDDEKAFDLGSDVDRLARAGVPLRTDRSEDHMHHKFAVFDRQILVTGSYNWTKSAAYRNHENIAVTDDRRLVAAFSREFDRLWADFAPS